MSSLKVHNAFPFGAVHLSASRWNRSPSICEHRLTLSLFLFSQHDHCNFLFSFLFTWVVKGNIFSEIKISKLCQKIRVEKKYLFDDLIFRSSLFTAVETAVFLAGFMEVKMWVDILMLWYEVLTDFLKQNVHLILQMSVILSLSNTTVIISNKSPSKHHTI